MTEEDKLFIGKWFGSLFTVWYISVMLYIHDPYLLQLVYWPLHTHDIEIKVIQSTVDWQYWIDRFDKDLEKGILYDGK
mgnify:CR=1 FL=1